MENESAGLLNFQLDFERKILEALNEKTLQDKSVQQLIKRVENMHDQNEQLVRYFLYFLRYLCFVNAESACFEIFLLLAGEGKNSERLASCTRPARSSKAETRRGPNE